MQHKLKMNMLMWKNGHEIFLLKMLKLQQKMEDTLKW